MGLTLWCFYLHFDILAALHPTPAVCGLPEEEARLLIKEIGEILAVCIIFLFDEFSRIAIFPIY